MRTTLIPVIALFALSGCGGERDIMGYTPEDYAPKVVDASLISEDRAIQKTVLAATSDVTDSYKERHLEIQKKHLKRVQRMELEFASLAKTFEDECMTREQMKNTKYCNESRDNALLVDKLIREEKLAHVKALNDLKDKYSSKVNDVVLSL